MHAEFRPAIAGRTVGLLTDTAAQCVKQVGRCGALFAVTAFRTQPIMVTVSTDAGEGGAGLGRHNAERDIPESLAYHFSENPQGTYITLLRTEG